MNDAPKYIEPSPENMKAIFELIDGLRERAVLAFEGLGIRVQMMPSALAPAPKVKAERAGLVVADDTEDAPPAKDLYDRASCGDWPKPGIDP